MNDKLIAGLNIFTRWVVLGPVLLWAVWELVLLGLRAKYGNAVMLVSMQARSIAARGLPSLAYALAGLSVHFFVTWPRMPMPDKWIGPCYAFWWACLVGYLIADWLDPSRFYWPLVTQYIRHPTFAALAGAVFAFFFFPQTSIWTPGHVR